MTVDKKFIDQFIKVSTKAALASSYMVGKKDKNAADNKGLWKSRGFNAVSTKSLAHHYRISKRL